MASFSCSVVPQSYDYAALDASFTGGDSEYTRRRFIRFTISGGGYTSTWNILSNEVGGADSTFQDDVAPLTGSTTYTWSATLGYYDGSGAAQLSGYSDSGSFTTPVRTYTLGIRIIYDANGGSGAPSSTIRSYPNESSPTAQKTLTLSSTVPIRSGYDFIGWLLDDNKYAPGEAVTLIASEPQAEYTAVAQWSQGGPFIWSENKWNPAQPYIYATKNGVTKWWPATAYIYANGHWNPQ